MRRIRTTSVRASLLLILSCLFSSCTDLFQDEMMDVPCEVGFYAGGAETRTEMLSDGLSAVWVPGDEIAVWARSSSGAYVLSNQVFKTYGLDGGLGYFTSTLNSPMPSGSYTYFCCYPVPTSISGTTARFTIPSVQDGKVTGGADIMIADPVSHGALTPVPDPEDHSGMSMSMNRMLHQFRFYVPETDTKLGSSKIERIQLSFPTDVVGDINLNVLNPSQGPNLISGGSDITLMLAEPISVSDSDDIQYACVAFLPTSYEKGTSGTYLLSLKAYTDSKFVSFDPIDMTGRNFRAGHSTPVKLKVKSIEDYGRIRFTVSSNNIGENANSVTLTLPDGYAWPDTGTKTYTYNPGREFTTGESFEVIFEDMDLFRSLSGKTVGVSFDTEHVTTNQTVTLPNMGSTHLAQISAGLPYLLYEDFSGVESFNSGDKYATSNIGDKSAKSFLNGWTGGRIGAEAGKCIRIACRRETSNDYHARVDSAPIIQLKKSARISVMFDYGMNNQYGGISLITNPDVGQTFFVGYVTNTKGYSSASTDGVFEAGNSQYVFEKSGSYDSTPNTETYYLNNVPTGTVRITWRTEVQHQAGMNNTTCWLYIDNVKVQIAK
ncbi:MAG: hypothetical protein IKB85_08800 [Bacteroidales bacterium]|nr:hypothetical protein [Bacteroidales bacterium]